MSDPSASLFTDPRASPRWVLIHPQRKKTRMSEMTPERLHEIRSGFQSRRGTDAWGIWPEEAMRELLAEVDRLRGELEGRTQPTRDEVEMEIAVAWGQLTDVESDAVLAREAVSALVVRGWLGVSDTPNETGRE